VDKYSIIRENIFSARVPSMGGNHHTRDGVWPIYYHHFLFSTRTLFYDGTLNHTTVLSTYNNIHIWLKEKKIIYDRITAV